MTQSEKWKAYQEQKQVKRKALNNRASSITRTLVNLACNGHCTGNSPDYARLFSEYKTIEKRLRNM